MSEPARVRQPADEEGAPTLIAVRDKVVDCFAATHGPRFVEARTHLGLETHHEAVRGSVEGMVRLAFRLAGGSFESPTIEVMTRVVNILAERSACWGVPEDMVFEHHCEMMRELGKILVAQSSHGGLASDC